MLDKKMIEKMIQQATQQHEQAAINLGFRSKQNSNYKRTLAVYETVAIVDMFYKKVLVPFDKMGQAADDDMLAVLAWKTVDGNLDTSNIIDPVYKLSTRLIMCASAYESLSTMTKVFIDNAIDEMEAYENGDLPEEDCLFATALEEHVLEHVNDFINEYVLKIDDDAKVKMLTKLFEYYRGIAERISQKVSGVSFNFDDIH